VTPFSTSLAVPASGTGIEWGDCSSSSSSTGMPCRCVLSCAVCVVRAGVCHPRRKPCVCACVWRAECVQQHAGVACARRGGATEGGGCHRRCFRMPHVHQACPTVCAQRVRRSCVALLGTHAQDSVTCMCTCGVGWVGVGSGGLHCCRCLSQQPVVAWGSLVPELTHADVCVTPVCRRSGRHHPQVTPGGWHLTE
jgi:hypothetical protein